MPLEVYSTTKPASRLRAWLSSIVLLAVAGTLAGSMSRGGARAGILGDLVAPEGWDMAFRPPTEFQEIDPDPEHFASTYRFHSAIREGVSVELIFWRIRAPEGTTPLIVCLDVLDTAESWFVNLFGPPRTRALAHFGDREGVEIHNPSVPMIVRSVVLGNGWAYAVSIRVQGAPMDETTYRLFDRVCRAVRIPGRT